MHFYNINACVPFDTYPGYTEQTAKIFESVCKAVLAGQCCAFVGAGVSMRSRLPDWRSFVNYMADQYKIDGTRDGDLIRRFIDRGDLITAAELIKLSNSVEKSTFHKLAATYLQAGRDEYHGDARYRHGVAPDDVHRLITRTAFQKVITTNYDDLLVMASRQAGIIAHTDIRRDAKQVENNDIISALVSGNPAIIHIHGSVSSPESMVITRKDYLDAYSGGFLVNWLRSQLMQKSFLFVGYSLSDFDIVNLIKEAKATLPRDVTFGPHFAILDGHETSPAHRAYLENCYNIRTIVDNIRSDPVVLRQIFAYIHGICSATAAKGETFASQPPFTLGATTDSIMKSMLENVGCDYIDLYVAENVDKVDLRRLYRRAGPDNTAEYRSPFDASSPPPPPELRRLYLTMRDNNYYYTPLAAPELVSKYAIEPVSGLPVKSVLVMPVSSQGKKIGLMVAGSVIEGAFTPYHYDALAVHAKLTAESYKSLLGKLTVVRAAQRGLSFRDVLAKLAKSRLLNALIQAKQFDCILYAVDYVHGKLVPHFSEAHDAGPAWPPLPIGDPYLACDAVTRGCTLHFANAGEALSYVGSSDSVREGLQRVREGLAHFRVTGNLYLTPIRSNGYISAVLVCWDNSEQKAKRYTQFERAKRIVRVLLNNHSRPGPQPADVLLDDLDRNMARYDGGSIDAWTKALRTGDKKFVTNVIHAALRSLVGDHTQLTRVRLWVHTTPKGLRDVSRFTRGTTGRLNLESITFEVRHSYTDPRHARPGAPHVDQFVGYSSSADDEYTQNTIYRYATDPYARVIDPLSGETPNPDRNAGHLDKDPNGAWLTVPLVYRDRGPSSRRLHLMGFLSADDHVLDNGRYVKPATGPGSPLLTFQRCAMDLVAHIISPLMQAAYFPNDQTLSKGT